MFRILTFLFALVCSHSVQSQKNVEFRSQLDYEPILNDIWGYEDTSGNEYALVGMTTGVSIVDVTNPDVPNELFFISGPNSTWRDIKTWDGYAYVTNETDSGPTRNQSKSVTYQY